MPKAPFKRGKYEIHPLEDGGHRIYGPGKPKGGKKVPPEHEILRMYHSDMKHGRLSGSTRAWFKELGVIHLGRMDNPALRRHLGLNETWISRDQIESAIKEFWPDEDIRIAQAYQGSLYGIEEFRKQNPKLYNATNGNRFRNFKAVVKSMEEPYASAYTFMSGKVDHKEINRTTLGNTLLDWFYQGRSICPAALSSNQKDSQEYRVFREINCLSNHSVKRTPSGIIADLTSLDQRDISMSRKESKRSSVVAENLISFMLHWAPILEVPINGIEGDLETAPDRNEFVYNGGKQAFSDLRVGNKALEVKSYFGPFAGQRLEDFLARYSDTSFNLWASGEPLETTYAFFLQPDSTYELAKKHIDEAGIDLMDQATIRSNLEAVVTGLEARPDLTAGLNPVPNLPYLLRLHQELQESCFVMRSSNHMRHDWTNRMLNGLVGRAREIRQSKYEQPESIEVPLSIPDSKLRSRGKVPFLETQRDIADIGADILADYIAKHRDLLTVDSIKKTLGYGKPLKKREILAWDLETAGLRYVDPIVSISYATFDGQKVVPGVLLARDFSEEKPMIEYFLEMMDDKLLLTYNGNAFDVPRLGFRAKHNGIKLGEGKYEPLKQQLNGRHIDLLPLANKEFEHLSDKKLKTLERLVFGFHRGNDLPGAEVPRTYAGWMGEEVKERKRRNPLTERQKRERLAEKMNGIVEHNLVDSVTLIALLAKLGEPKK